ncbi:hypothetical protein [Mycobacterium sp. SMC-4]|uniref:hypothetical protein n=1 Tax=Mycobacterium sp. SMC-4 TaxID=2857059 RepID=UPI0021B41C92|nr:hypothetical protein [Mycobacterium sp. SMC-4]UXA19519.1 hypothetical protein KXD98_07940 [Mycobacterium sp. SMC-4]
MSDGPDELSIMRARRQNRDTEQAVEEASWPRIESTLDALVADYRRHDGTRGLRGWHYRHYMKAGTVKTLAALLAIAVQRLARTEQS